MTNVADALLNDNLRVSFYENSYFTCLRGVSDYGCCSFAFRVEVELENDFVMFALLNHLLCIDFA